MRSLGRLLGLSLFSAVILAAQNQSTPQAFTSDPWRLGGDLYLNYQPISKQPSFIRGQLPYQRWNAGWQLQMRRRERITFNFGFSVAGGTPFDNPERLNYSISTLVGIARGLSFLGGVNVGLNINQHPIVDPSGRIENTGINELFTGLSFAKIKSFQVWNINNQAYITKNIRSNIPVFNNDRTSPYIGWRAGNNLTLGLNFKDYERWKLRLESYVEGNDTSFLGDPGAVGANLTLNTAIHRHLVWQTGAMIQQHNRTHSPKILFNTNY